MKRYTIKHRDETPAVACPCGQARRILTQADNDHVSVHVVEISRGSQVHYHKKLTETYYVLEGEGSMELDGHREPVRPGSVVHIPPGVRHRAVGNLTILNIVTPPFDPADEHHDLA